MAILLSLVISFLLIRFTFTLAAPHYALSIKDRRLSGCSFPTFPGVSCNNGIVNFQSSVGNISGTLTPGGAIRFTVKYATAQRFKPPQIAQVSSSGFAQSTTLPKMCPQGNIDASAYSEDCLYFVAYAPINAAPVSFSGGAPVIVWIHGGSYYQGSASDPFLDGSKLAQATGSVVVVLQYRLGVLGYLPPASQSANKNLGVQDVMTALKYIQNIIGCVGGDKTKVVLAGQSSGANLIRNLLATPSASSLFSRAILESDPMSYGFLSPTTFTNLQSAFYGNASCGSCLTTPVSTLLSIQANIISTATTIDPAAGMAQPIRPVLDGTLITYSLTKTFPSTLKNLLLTTTKDEAGPAMYGALTFPVPPSWFDSIAQSIYGMPRATAVGAQYKIASEVTDDIRPALVVAGTDAAWRCPNYSFARTWAAKGGNVWVGEFDVGSTYSANTQYDFCTTNGAVCHQDDIPIVFGTVSSPTAAQTALIAQIQARWGAFVKTGSPNTSGFQNWSQVDHNGGVPVMNLGGTTPVSLGACDPSVWGSAILYDYQIYNQ